MSSPDASLDYERCLELTLDIPNAPKMVSTLTGMWGYYTSRADLKRARQVSSTLQALISDDWGAFWRPQNIASFAMLDWYEGDFTRAADQLERAIDALYARASFDTEAVAAWYLPTHPTVAMHAHLAIAQFMAGDIVSADEHGHRALQFSEGLPFPQGPWSAAYTRWLLGWMLMERGDHDQSLKLLSEASSIGDRYGYDAWSLIALTQHAATAAARDIALPESASIVPGDAIFASLVAAWQTVELRNSLTIYLTMLGQIAAKRGDTEGALRHYEESLALSRDTGMAFYDAETLRCQAHLAHDRDDVTRRLHEALDLARRQGARPFELRIALDLSDIRGEAAAPELSAAVAGFRADASYRELDDARARLAGFGR
jgi:tetratricopeptide (TPR) repeat protein